MKILTMGLETEFLRTGSRAQNRIKKYSEMIDKYIAIFPYERDVKLELSDKLTIYGIGGANKIIKLLKIYYLSRKILSEEKFDMVSSQEPFELAYICYLLSRKYKLALEIHERGDRYFRNYWRNEELINFYRYCLGKFLLKKADMIRVVSKRSKDRLMNDLGISGDKIMNFAIFTDPKQAIESDVKVDLKEKYKGKFIFMTMCRLVKQKNLPMLIRAFKDVVNVYQSSMLVIIGSGAEKKKLLKLVGDLGLKIKLNSSVGLTIFIPTTNHRMFMF